MSKRSVKYSGAELRVGMILKSGLTIRGLMYRPGRGLEIRTLHGNGYLGPTMYAGAKPFEVIYAPSMSEDDLHWLTICTTDYPWAETVGLAR